MTSLRTNLSALTALTTLKGIAVGLDATSRRVATGQRVATAADSAAYWSIATAVRTDNAALAAVKDTLGLGGAAVGVAANGLDAVLSDLRNLRAKLQTALQPGVDRAKVQTEIAAIQARMRGTAQTSSVSGRNWLSIDSSAGAYRPTERIVSGVSRDASGALQVAAVEIPIAGIALYDAAVQQTAVPATTARVTAGEALGPATDFGAGQSVRLTLSIDGAAGRDLLLDASTLASAVPDLSAVTPGGLVQAIGNLIAADPALAGQVRAGLDGAGRLTFETAAAGAARSLRVDRTSAGGGGSGASLVTSGGFEGGAPGWSLSSTSVAGTPRSGASALSMGAVGFNGSASQTLATVPGQSYTLEYWLQTMSGLPNHFAVIWDGTTIYATDDAAASPYTAHSFTVTASGASTTLTFEGRHDPSYFYVDDVSVTPLAAPGPSLGFGATATASGSDASLTAGRGLLDTADAATGVSVATIDVAGLSGAAGDTSLAALVAQVETVIGRVTEAGAWLGAAATQIDGQRVFLDTLTKANDRTIGILVDADIEEESVRLKALQTQQQLAVQALSIANGSSQTLLALFR